MTRAWLHRSTVLQVVYRDRTAHGGPIGSRIEHAVRAAFPEAIALLDAGRAGDDPDVLDALASGVGSEAFHALVTVEPAPPDGTAPSGWTVAERVRHPDPDELRPHQLVVTAPGGAELDVRLPHSHWALAHDLLARLNAPDGLPTDGGDLHPDMAALLAALRDLGALTAEPLDPHPTIATRPGLTFLGHNAALVRADRAAVLIDPFLRRPDPRYPDDFQPITCDQLGPVDAILITHGHPDHFDPGSLLRFPLDTPVIVPVVERESILAPDLRRRVAELGFTDVRARAWGATEQVGDIAIDVLPFYGEQPTEGPRLHPDVVNAGNAYAVRTPQLRAAFVADAGRDDRGSTAGVGARYRAEHGPVDVVFAGYRGWRTTPAGLLNSSVGRYFLFVPPSSWPRSMDLMTDAAGALAVAGAFGAPTLVPYADGGAPWFWELGLGPRLDETPAEREGFDPFPERVSALAATTPDAPHVALLRPGQRIEADGGITELDGHRWPWSPVVLSD